MGVFSFTNLAWEARGGRSQAFNPRQRQANLCEFKARLIYTELVSGQPWLYKKTVLKNKNKQANKLTNLLALSAG